VLPVIADEDVHNLPIAPDFLQQELAHFLLEYSPFTEVQIAKHDNGGRLANRFYVDSRLFGGQDGGFGSATNMAAQLTVRITLADREAPVFEKTYTASHSLSGPWSEANLVPHLLVQWKKELLRDLGEFTASGAWQRATEDWRVQHSELTRLLIPDDSQQAIGDRGLLRRVGEILQSRQCASVIWEPQPTLPRSRQELERSAADFDVEFVIGGQWESLSEPLRFAWWIWSQEARRKIGSGETEVIESTWQFENGARSVAGRIGEILQSEREAHTAGQP